MNNLYTELQPVSAIMPYRRLWQAYINQRFCDLIRGPQTSDLTGALASQQKKENMIAYYEALKFFKNRGPWYTFVCDAAGYEECMVNRIYERVRTNESKISPFILNAGFVQKKVSGYLAHAALNRDTLKNSIPVAISTNCGM